MLLFGLGDILSPIKTWFQSLLENLIFRIFYMLETLILRFVKLVEDTMMIFTGEKLVKYDTKDTTLIDVFFNHGTAKSIYTGIAIIGIMIAFAFAIIAVVRKIGDLRDKQQGVTLGAILGNLLKSIMLIVGMNFIMIVALSATNALTKSISQAVMVDKLLRELSVRLSAFYIHLRYLLGNVDPDMLVEGKGLIACRLSRLGFFIDQFLIQSH